MLRENLPCFSSCLLPVILSLGTTEKNPASAFFALFLQVFIYFDEIILSLLQAEQSQHSEPFLLWGTLQSLHDLYGPLLDCLQYVPVSLVSVSCQGSGLVYAQCDEVRCLTLKFIPWPSLLSWRVHHPCFSLLTCFLHPGICKGCTSYSLQVTWWNFFWTCCFISVEIVYNKHEMHLCIFPACDFHKKRINFLLQWNELIRGLEYRSTQLLITVLFFCLGFLGFFPHTFISNWWIKFP